MKRLFQFVAFGLVLLATAQPLLADNACDQRQCEGSPVCSVCFDSMAAPGLAMQRVLASSQTTSHVVSAGTGCSYGSCWLRSGSTTFVAATPPIFAPTSSKFFVSVAPFFASPAVVLVTRSSEGAAAGAVPRNILFQVFRI